MGHEGMGNGACRDVPSRCRGRARVRVRGRVRPRTRRV